MNKPKHTPGRDRERIKKLEAINSELLEALKTARQTIYDICEHTGDVADELCEIDAAIAKATGGADNWPGESDGVSAMAGDDYQGGDE